MTREIGRTALVTGGSRGIGRSVADKLIRIGYTVIVPSRIELDLSSPASVEDFVKRNQSVKIDVIVNNAGVNNPALVEEFTDRDIEETMNVNLISPLRLVRGLVRHMKAQRYGRIVNASSIFGVVSKEKRALYSMTKFGLNGLTKSLAVELGQFGILVNSVCPGYTNTEMTRRNVSPEERVRIEATIPLRRFAESDEIAEVIVFLASDRNTYITGETVIVDGGFTSL